MEDDELMKKLNERWVTWVLVLIVLLCLVGLAVFTPGPPP